MTTNNQKLGTLKEQRILEIAVGCGAEIITVCNGEPNSTHLEFNIPNLLKFAKVMQEDRNNGNLWP